MRGNKSEWAYFGRRENSQKAIILVLVRIDEDLSLDGESEE